MATLRGRFSKTNRAMIVKLALLLGLNTKERKKDQEFTVIPWLQRLRGPSVSRFA